MDAPENFKLDVRIRARMLAKGALAEADVQKHLEALPDLSPTAETLDANQPAIGTPSERPVLPPPRPRAEPRPAPIVQPPSERSQPRSIAPGPLAVDEGWDDDDDDEELDDEEETAEEKPAEKPVAAASPPPVPEPEPPVPVVDDDEDQVDDEDSEEPTDRGEEE